MLKCSNLRTLEAHFGPGSSIPLMLLEKAQRESPGLVKAALWSLTQDHHSLVQSCVEVLKCLPKVSEVALGALLDHTDDDQDTWDNIESLVTLTNDGVDLPNPRALSFLSGAVMPLWPHFMYNIFNNATLLHMTELTVFEHSSILDNEKLCALFANVESFKISGYGLGYDLIEDLETELTEFSRLPKLRALSFDPGAQLWPFVTLRSVLSPSLPKTIESVVFNVSVGQQKIVLPNPSSQERHAGSTLREIIMHDVSADGWSPEPDEESSSAEEKWQQQIEVYKQAKLDLCACGITVRLLDEDGQDLLK